MKSAGSRKKPTLAVKSRVGPDKMGVMKRIAWVFIGLGLLSLLSSGCEDSYDVKFATYQDVKGKGYLAKGWIPECLPNHAYHFLERHDLDTNEVWLFFRFKPEDDVAMKNALSERSNSEWKFYAKRSPAPFWWPKAMPRRVRFYTYVSPSPCRRYFQVAFVAVDWADRYVYFKSP